MEKNLTKVLGIFYGFLIQNLNEFRFKINDGVSLLEEYDEYEEKKVALITNYNEKNNFVAVIFDDNGLIVFDNWEQNKIKLA